MGITKQSVNDLLGHLEGHGYLLRVPDSVDGRARVIRLTAKGRRLQETIYAAAGAAQLQIEEILGPRRFAQLHSSLELLTEQLGLTDRPLTPAADWAAGQGRPADRKAWLRWSGAQASQASSIASRNGFLVATLRWTKTAA